MNEIYLSAKDVANYVGSKVRTIENWAAAGNIEQNDQGKYGLISAYKYRLDKITVDLGQVRLQLSQAKEDLSTSKKDLDQEAYEAKKRKMIAEADKESALAKIKELELKKFKEELVDKEEVLDTWKNAVANVKAKMIAIPVKVALELSGIDNAHDIQTRLTTVIDEALIELGNN